MRKKPRRVTRSLSLLIALLGVAALYGSAERAAPEPESNPTGTVVLTAARPLARIPIPPEAWKEKRTSLVMNIIKIKNPLSAAFSIEVSLEPRSTNGTAAKPTEIGVLGIYPAGQTGSYRLETSSALRRVHASGADANRLCLRLVLRRVHPKEPLEGLEITLSAPQWLPAN